MNDSQRAAARRRFWNRYAGGLRGAGGVEAVDAAGKHPPVLAFHGFGCVPDEVDLLSSLGIELGLRTRAPLLPGHGLTVAALAQTRYSDWLLAAEGHLLELSETGPVILGGQSMGAVLALELAVRHPTRCLALVLFANAVRLANPFPGLALRAASLLGIPDFALPKWGGPDLRDPETFKTHTTYEGQPFLAAASLERAGSQLIERLPRVHCPTFIAHGLLDRTAPVSNAWLVADRLGTTDVEVHVFAKSGHILTKDLERGELRVRVRTFLTRIIAERPRS